MSKSGHSCPCQNCSWWPPPPPNKRLGEDLCWIIPHVLPTTQSVKGLNSPEPKLHSFLFLFIPRGSVQQWEDSGTLVGCWNERFLHYVFPSNSSSYHWQKPERNSWQHQLYNTSNSTYIQTFSAGGATWGPSCKPHTALPGGHLKRDKQTNHVQHKYKYRTREIACHKKKKHLNLRRNYEKRPYLVRKMF